MIKPNYGIDAPPVIKQLLLMGLSIFILGVIIYFTLIKHVPVLAITLFTITLFSSAFQFISAGWMLWSSFVGKKHMRDKLIDSLNLQGNERVLDVGCGRGLLLIGAAKKLTRGGKATGIDLWSQQDLSNNQAVFTKENAELERVSDRIQIISGDMTNMHFEDNSFDAVIASMAIHNVPTAEKRNVTIQHISRVLKPGGQVALLDFQCTKEYQRSLFALGWKNVLLSKRYFWMFPPVRIVTGKKPII